MYLSIILVLFTLANSQTCRKEQGPCLNEICPGEGNTCLGGIVCCSAEDIIKEEEISPVESLETEAPIIPSKQTIPPVVPTTPPKTPVVIGCVDNAKVNCVMLKKYCIVKQYKDLLTRNCPVTCNRCQSVGVSAGCADLPSANCYRYTSLCNNSAYRTLLEKNCPRTCNFCPALKPKPL